MAGLEALVAGDAGAFEQLCALLMSSQNEQRSQVGPVECRAIECLRSRPCRPACTPAAIRGGLAAVALGATPHAPCCLPPPLPASAAGRGGVCGAEEAPGCVRSAAGAGAAPLPQPGGARPLRSPAPQGAPACRLGAGAGPLGSMVGLFSCKMIGSDRSAAGMPAGVPWCSLPGSPAPPALLCRSPQPACLPACGRLTAACNPALQPHPCIASLYRAAAPQVLTRDDASIWPGISPPGKAAVKQEMLNCIREEPMRAVTKKVGAVQGWGGLVPWCLPSCWHRCRPSGVHSGRSGGGRNHGGVCVGAGYHPCLALTGSGCGASFHQE